MKFMKRNLYNFVLIGTWRSPVAHLTGGQGVASSNLAVPTLIKQEIPSTRWDFFIPLRYSNQITPSRSIAHYGYKIMDTL